MISRKASVGSGLVWIPALFVIGLVLFLHIFLTLGIFAKTLITDDSDIELKESYVDLDSRKMFLDFLNSEIVVDGREDRVIDFIGYSLDPYFSIKNSEGKSFFQFFNPDNISPGVGISKRDHRDELRRKMLSNGFKSADVDRIISLRMEFQDSELFREIVSGIENYCGVGENGRLSLELPQGLIQKERNEVSYSDGGSFLVSPGVVEIVGIYRGESYKVKFFVLGGCR